MKTCVSQIKTLITYIPKPIKKMKVLLINILYMLNWTNVLIINHKYFHFHVYEIQGIICKYPIKCYLNAFSNNIIFSENTLQSNCCQNAGNMIC